MTNQTHNRDNLGEPDIELAGLQIWVHGRQFQNNQDYWDANWLNVTAHCSAQGASVWVSGDDIFRNEASIFRCRKKHFMPVSEKKGKTP